MAEHPFPGFVASGPAPERADGRRPLRFAALVGAVASALWVVAFFLPWVEFPDGDRVRIRAALEPSIESLSTREPEHAERYRILLKQVVDEGHLTGLDLHHFARSALALNRTLIGTDPGGHDLDRPWVVQRALQSAEFGLLALPILGAFVALLLLARGFRRIGSPILALLVVLGLVATAVAVAWLRFGESLSTGIGPGDGIRLALGASVAQACAGLFGVTAKTWWKVYAVALLVTGALAFFGQRYVTSGSLP
jgi:hypothetical protein